MAEDSKIEWTDATWNPATGCTKVSEACTHCYIDRTPPFRMAHRKFVAGHVPIELHPDRIDKPLNWKKPRKIFVNSLSDLFHADIPDQYIVDVFATMYEAQWHTFQVLTKRPERMRSLLSNPRFPWAVGCRAWDRLRKLSAEKAELVTREDIIGDVMQLWPLENVWIGVTAENQKRADERIPLLLQTPAATRFISAEPLLGPLSFRWAAWQDLSRDHATDHLDGLRRLDWVIVGGESGQHARPMHPQWARDIRDQCVDAGVPFFFKQWGEWGTHSTLNGLPHFRQFTGHIQWVHKAQTWVQGGVCLDSLGRECSLGVHFARARDEGTFPVTIMDRVGKKAAGRLLDGREWNEFPEQKVSV